MIEKHFTVTTYVIDEKKALLIFHPKHNRWLPPGGHLEPNETPPECAKREVLEETGLEVELIPQENLWIAEGNATSFERPYFCLLCNVPPHNANPAHQHIDLIYLARPTGKGALHNTYSARWFTFDDLLRLKIDIEIFSDTHQMIQHLLS
jgi:8-oxo-dGTP pyrophosphatase MutT (NUDIX family)